MIIRKTTEEAVDAAARATNVHVRYGFKPYWHQASGPLLSGENRLGVAHSLTIRPGEGCTQRRRSHRGRRTHAVCWHGHRDFFRALFEHTPDAVVISCLARYEGVADFEQRFPATGDTNIGSRMEPCTIQDACECREGAF